jgi:hypothetical protein
MTDAERQPTSRRVGTSMGNAERPSGFDIVEEASRDSFPASDAPAWTPVTGVEVMGRAYDDTPGTGRADDRRNRQTPMKSDSHDVHEG